MLKPLRHFSELLCTCVIVIAALLVSGQAAKAESDPTIPTQANITAEMVANLDSGATNSVPTVIDVSTLSTPGVLSYSGTFTNASTLYLVSSSSAVTSATLEAKNIYNQVGGVITTSTAGLGLPGLVPNLNLALIAKHNIFNAGVISSAGDLTVNAGRSVINGLPTGITALLPTMQAAGNMNVIAGNIANAGILSAIQNINITSQMVNNIAGQVMASQSINFLAPIMSDRNSINVTGGTFRAPTINFNVGINAVVASVDEFIGKINFSGGTANLATHSGILTVGNVLAQGPSALVNTGGDIVLTNDINTTGQDLAILASGSIFSYPYTVVNADGDLINTSDCCGLPMGSIIMTRNSHFFGDTLRRLEIGNIAEVPLELQQMFPSIYPPGSTSIDLSSKTGPGGSLNVVAGYNIEQEYVNQRNHTVYRLTGPSETGGSLVIPIIRSTGVFGSTGSNVTLISTGGLKYAGSLIAPKVIATRQNGHVNGWTIGTQVQPLSPAIHPSNAFCNLAIFTGQTPDTSHVVFFDGQRYGDFYPNNPQLNEPPTGRRVCEYCTHPPFDLPGNHYYVDAKGTYWGGFNGGSETLEWYAKYVPAGAIEVPYAPSDAHQHWNGASWDALSNDNEFPGTGASHADTHANERAEIALHFGGNSSTAYTTSGPGNSQTITPADQNYGALHLATPQPDLHQWILNSSRATPSIGQNENFEDSGSPGSPYEPIAHVSPAIQATMGQQTTNFKEVRFEDSAGNIYVGADSNYSHSAPRAIDLKSGVMFGCMGENTKVSTAFGRVHVRKGGIVMISAKSRYVCIQSCGGPGNIWVETCGKRIPLPPGQELCLTDQDIALVKDVQRDQIGRRNETTIPLDSQTFAHISDFSPFSLIETSPLLQSLRHSSDSRAKSIHKTLIKTAAAVYIATNGKGIYH